MNGIEKRLRRLLEKLSDNEEYILGVLDNAPHNDDREYLCRYIEEHPDTSISDAIVISLELGMIRDGELEPL